MNAWLGGISVLDMTEGVAGPCAASQLGDMGASVIKIERPQGDWGRGSEDPLGPYFVANNRNKRDLCIDLQKAPAGEIARRLVARSDVIVSNYRKGVMERLGLGYDACRTINPDIVYCTISAFGREGPYAGRPASDTGMQGLTGIMDAIGEFDGPPLRVSFPLVDIYSGSLAVQGILLALLSRQQGKRATRIDVSLLNAALSLQAMPFAYYQRTGELPKRSGNHNPVLSPAGAYRTKDGKYMTVTVLGDTYWERFCRAIDLKLAGRESEFGTNSLRVRNRATLNEMLTPVFLGKVSSEWFRIMQQADILCYPINTFEEALDDPALASAMSLWSVDDAGTKMRTVGNPIEIDGEFPTLKIPPPLKGEHTIVILAELGFSRSEIDTMLSQAMAYQNRSVI